MPRVKGPMQISYEAFKQEGESIKNDIDAQYAQAKKNISVLFQRLLDNMPQDMLTTSFSQCKENYKRTIADNKVDSVLVEHIREIQMKDEQVEINDEHHITHNHDETNILDFESHLSQKMTSTVKRPLLIKSIGKENKPDMMIDTIVDESEKEPDEQVDETMADYYENNTNKNNQTQSCIKIVFKLKNGDEATCALNEIKMINFSQVDDKCVQDLKKIRSLFA